MLWERWDDGFKIFRMVKKVARNIKFPATDRCDTALYKETDARAYAGDQSIFLRIKF